jgi:hypothetical protein
MLPSGSGETNQAGRYVVSVSHPRWNRNRKCIPPQYDSSYLPQLNNLRFNGAGAAGRASRALSLRLVFDPEAPFGLSYIRPELMSKAGSKTDPKIMFALVELVFFS